MIKKIHYVWFGGKPLPENVKSCINSWKRYLPDWEIIQWNESNFDTNHFRWVREALSVKKYAFAADFVRLYVINKMGGVYLDTDVEIYRNLEPLLKNSVVCGIQNHHYGVDCSKVVSEQGIDKQSGQLVSWFCVQAGFIYAEPNNPFLVHCLDKLYEKGNRAFIKQDGTTNQFVIDLRLMLELKEYGAVFRDKTQYLKQIDLMLYNSTFFATRKSKCKDSYLVHWFDQSWKPANSISMWLKKFIKQKLYFIYRK